MNSISKQTLKRLPLYMGCLRVLEQDKIEYVSAPVIAEKLDFNEVKVRKDLSSVSKSQGVPKKGFLVKDLMHGISELVGYNNAHDAVIVGTGKLGKALMYYKGFEEYGINIVAGFDNDIKQVNNKNIFHISKIVDVCQRLKVKIAIITVPAFQAQEVADLLVDCGILAIWNFAPVHLKTDEKILVQNENMASSLALLSKHLKERLDS